MIHIKRFIDRVSAVESKQGKDLVLPMTDARGLRDDLAKLLADRYEETKATPEEVISIQVKGGSFK